MSKNLRSFLLAVFFASAVVSVCHAQEPIRAGIGLQIKKANGVKWAKSKDRLNAGDLLRIYVSPDFDSYIYAIHSDQEKVTLLNHEAGVGKIKKDSIMILPSIAEFYEVDGTSKMELFTIICSPTRRADIDSLLISGDCTPSSWSILEERLKEVSDIDLNEISVKPFSLAGNVRGIDEEAEDIELKAFSGRALLVKQYKFSVTK